MFDIGLYIKIPDCQFSIYVTDRKIISIYYYISFLMRTSGNYGGTKCARASACVRAFSRADEVVVEVLASGESDDAFYIVMPSDIAPLEHASRFVRPDHWLRALPGPRQRALLWKICVVSPKSSARFTARAWSKAGSMAGPSITQGPRRRPISAWAASSFA